jgi:hypothetical protein
MAAVPVELRAAVAHELDRLVRGDLPHLLHWVNSHRDQGVLLIRQPDEIWEHRYTDALRTDDGGWHVVVPLFTTTESPSDLSAQIVVDPTGNATLHDVSVL